MNISHLCKCPNCSKETAVELRQAGQSLVCKSCQKSFDAPKLRELKALPLSEPSRESGAANRSTGKAGTGRMFAIGLALAILFGVSGGALYRYAVNMAPSLSPDQIIELQKKDHDNSSVNQLYDNWEHLYEERNTPEWQESNVKSLFVQSGYLKKIAWGLMSVAGLGLLLIAFSLITAGSSARRN